MLVSVFLVLASVKFLVQERQREYGLMRINGAARTRIILLALCEFTVPLALSNMFGCICGSLLTPVVGKIFEGTAEFHDVGIAFHPCVRFSVGLYTFLLMMITCLTGVWLAVRKIGLLPPLVLLRQESVKRQRIGAGRKITSCFLLVVIAVVGFMPFEALTLDLRSMLLTVLVIVCVYVSAPILVYGAVSVLGLILEHFGKGAGLLARQRARSGKAGSAAIALPAMMLLTIVVSFLAVFSAGSVGGSLLMLDPLKADLVVTSKIPAQTVKLSQGLKGLDKELRAVNTYETQDGRFLTRTIYSRLLGAIRKSCSMAISRPLPQKSLRAV